MIPVKALITAGSMLIEKLFPDPVKRAEAQATLLELEQSGELRKIEAAMTIVVAEAKSEHWIVAAWRPVTMLVFTAIVANNYLIYPYLSLFWVNAPVLTLPPHLWELLKIGLGGYVVGRSCEKSVQAWRNNAK